MTTSRTEFDQWLEQHYVSHERNTMKGMVFKSKFTPGLENAVDVKLDKGTRFKYRLLDGETVVSGVIDSGYAQHENGCYGYEVKYDDKDERMFADEERIFWWDGKIDTVDELDRQMAMAEPIR